MSARPFRSVLYIPGSKERALDKARGLAADAIIFDLEDAVAPEEKVAARAVLAEALTAKYKLPPNSYALLSLLEDPTGGQLLHALEQPKDKRRRPLMVRELTAKPKAVPA